MSDRLRAAARNLLETAESIRVEGRVKPQDAADLITDCEELRAALAEEQRRADSACQRLLPNEIDDATYEAAMKAVEREIKGRP